MLDRMGNTPLHYATQMWSQSVVRMLLERGANIGMKVVSYTGCYISPLTLVVGWDDFGLGSSALCPIFLRQMGFLQNQLSKQARWWNISNPSRTNLQVRKLMEHPVQLTT